MKKKFFYHYNKPMSQREKRPIISLHYLDKCHMLTGLVVDVRTVSRIRKKQPFFVMEGYANDVKIIDGIAHIN